MKNIDIHTGKSPEENRDQSIDDELVKEYVLGHIDFILPDHYWSIINDSFAENWNNQIGRGGYFYWDDIAKEVYQELVEQKVLIEYERLDIIVKLILTYIEEHNGFMEY